MMMNNRRMWKVTIAGVAMVCLWFVAWSQPVKAGEVTVAAAADLHYAFKELVPGFEAMTGHTVRLSLGSSGNFYAQLTQGAPFDVYFSADLAYPEKLEDAGLTVRGTMFQYAVGRLTVWAPTGSPVDVRALGMEAVLHPAVKRISIANPRHAPYGRAAVAALRHFDLYEKVEAKLVLGENVAQAAQFVQTGNADLGIIALSLAVAPSVKDQGVFWEIPLDAFPLIKQGAVMLKHAKDRQAAQEFLDYIKGATGRATLKLCGFYLPGEPIPGGAERHPLSWMQDGKRCARCIGDPSS